MGPIHTRWTCAKLPLAVTPQPLGNVPKDNHLQVRILKSKKSVFWKKVFKRIFRPSAGGLGGPGDGWQYFLSPLTGEHRKPDLPVKWQPSNTTALARFLFTGHPFILCTQSPYVPMRQMAATQLQCWTYLILAALHAPYWALLMSSG